MKLKKQNRWKPNYPSLKSNLSSIVLTGLTIGLASLFTSCVNVKNQRQIKKNTVVSPQNQDSDNDGVLDSKDLCPHTPGKEVSKGCPHKLGSKPVAKP
jgi:hypothetical protein